MKIGIVESGLPPESIGGAQVQAWKLARGLAARGHEITFFTWTRGAVPDGMREGVRIAAVRKHRSPMGFPFAVWRMTRRLNRDASGLDRVICFRISPAGLATALAAGCRAIPKAVWIRGGDWYFVQPTAWGRLVIRYVFQRMKTILVQTPRIAEEVKAAYPDHEVSTVSNGTEPDERTTRGDAVLFVGNLLWRKGVEHLVEAARRIPKTKFLIVGDGPERSRLESMSRDMPIEFVGRVLPGQVRDIMVERGRILVLPAVAGEGFPNVMLDAMEVGLPVIATDVAGVADVLDHGDAGIVVQPGNVDELAVAIQRLLRDESEWKRFSESGKKYVRRYEWEQVLPEVERVLAD